MDVRALSRTPKVEHGKKSVSRQGTQEEALSAVTVIGELAAKATMHTVLRSTEVHQLQRR